ncbi:MAG: efflux RND transporter permease subunit [Acidobacteria bacterium]|nr:efflux RND transporter permease subunit [Acidobacteriota bacterium]
MKLPEISIKNYQFTIMLYLLLVTFGIFSYLSMPRSEDPYVEFPMAGVWVIAPGISTIDMESAIADPLEERLNGIEGIDLIHSSIEDGLLMVQMEFESGTDMEQTKTRIESELTEAEKVFPSGVVDTEVWTADILFVKVLQVAVSGKNYELRDLWHYADMIKTEIQNVDGAKDVEVLGYPGEEVQIQVNPERLSQYNIPLIRIYGILQANNTNIPAGEVYIGNRKFNLRTSGKYESLKQIGETVIGAYEGKPVYLKDVATVDYVYGDPRYKIRYNGDNALVVVAEQQKAKNLLKIDEDFKKALDSLKQRLPRDLKVDVFFAQADSVKRRTSSFFMNLLQGIILVGVVVFLIVGKRPSIVIILAIPVSLITAIGIINISGFWIQQMTISALIISLGLLVDNAIVITENIQRYIDNGYSRLEAAIKGSNEVGWPIVSATATTVLAFVPMILMKDHAGDYIRSMPIGVAITLASSLLIALTLSPLLSRYSLKPTNNHKKDFAKNYFMRFIENRYKPLISKALQKRKMVILIAVVVFVITVSLFPLVGVSFFPPSDKPLMLVNVKLPQSASLEKTESVVNEVEKLLQDEPWVMNVVSNVGRGNAPVFYNMGGAKQIKNFGQILLILDPKINIDQITEFSKELRTKLDVFPEAKVEVKQFIEGSPTDAPLEIIVIGEDVDVLRKISLDVAKIVEETPGCINVDNPFELASTDLKLSINREEAMMLGVQIVDIDRVVRMAVSGLVVGNYQDDKGDVYDMVLRLPDRHQNWIENINKIYVPSASGYEIPLTQVAKIEFVPGYSIIHHRDLQRAIKINADAFGRDVKKINDEIAQKLDAYEFPVGYKYTLAGEEEARGESFSSMMTASIIAIIGIFGVLVLQFRSFMQPVIIFVSLPLAIIGSIYALLITGYTFSFTAFVGFASLIGIVVNNAIILVDYTNKLLADGMELGEAVIQAGSIRFRPIISTTLTTIGGLLPLTLTGGELWAPLGWVIIGGLLVSTVLTLLVIPVIYYILTNHLKKAKAQ